MLKDEVFFRASGGGVTLSGGEVLMQAEFATRFLQRLKQWGIRTAIETAGDTSPRRLLPLAQACDEVLFDLKIMDCAQARQVLSMNQPRVLENFRLLVTEGIKVIPRLPLIPGYTLSTENVAQILAFLAPLPVEEVHLLPFHQYGEPKYSLLEREWAMAGIKAPEAEEVAPIRAMVEQAGYRVVMGG